MAKKEDGWSREVEVDDDKVFCIFFVKFLLKLEQQVVNWATSITTTNIRTLF